MSNKTKIEICVNSAESAQQAQKAGVSRVVLCAGNTEWGTTPSFGAIRMARQHLSEAQLHVLIRPRGGDFLYSPLEQEVMLHDVKVARQLGANGVVFGCLNAHGHIDSALLKMLMNAVGNMEVTFNRAFDLCSTPNDAIDELIRAGVKRILTSGQTAQVTDALPQIKAWNEQAEGQLTFVLDAGVLTEQLEKIADETGCREFHLQASTLIESGMVYRNQHLTLGNNPLTAGYMREVVDAEIIHNALVELDKVNEKDEALEKLLRDAKAKKKKGRKSEDDDEEV